MVADFIQEPLGNCDSLLINFTNTSLGGQTYIWDFGDGNSSTTFSPSNIYIFPGVYDVSLIVYDPSKCEPYDTVLQQVSFFINEPDAEFDPDAQTFITHADIDFTNLSIDGDFYYWDFGDGETSDLENPVHNFSEPGEYEVCLRTTTFAGCVDSICKIYIIQNVPALDVPNAFSPNGDGDNDMLFVRGYGIANLDFQVFDRWGHLLFQTTDLNVGWDGIYKGKSQEMEVYVYYLSATFENGVAVEKKGNITLVR